MYDNDIRIRFALGDLIGVILVAADKHYGSLALWHLIGQPVSGALAGRNSQVEHFDQVVDGTCRTRPSEDHCVLESGAQRVMDRVTRCARS